MSMKTPLSGSTTGRPITIGTSLTTVHTSPTTQTAALLLSVINTAASASLVTLDVGGVSADFLLDVGAIEQISMSISAGDVLKMQGSIVGLRVVGTAESGHRQIAAL